MIICINSCCSKLGGTAFYFTKQSFRKTGYELSSRDLSHLLDLDARVVLAKWPRLIFNFGGNFYFKCLKKLVGNFMQWLCSCMADYHSNVSMQNKIQAESTSHSPSFENQVEDFCRCFQSGKKRGPPKTVDFFLETDKKRKI